MPSVCRTIRHSSGGLSSRSNTPVDCIRVQCYHDQVELSLLAGYSPCPEVCFGLDEPGFGLVGPKRWKFDRQSGYCGVLVYLGHISPIAAFDEVGTENRMVRRKFSHELANSRVLTLPLLFFLSQRSYASRSILSFFGLRVHCPRSSDPGRGHQ